MAGKRDEILEGLDHPIFFSMVLAIVVACWLAIFTYGAKAAGLPGLAALMQHP